MNQIVLNIDHTFWNRIPCIFQYVDCKHVDQKAVYCIDYNDKVNACKGLDFARQCLDFARQCLDFAGQCLDFARQCLDFALLSLYFVARNVHRE